MNGDDPADAAEAVNAMFAEIARHDDHAWQQIGRCVYCHDCQERLYQGRIPASHTNVKVLTPRSGTPKTTRDMRARWGMDDRPQGDDAA
jgi:hypothetical protein